VKSLHDKKNSSNNATCECVEERIQHLLDLRQPLMDDVLIRDHVAQCDDCDQLVADFGELDASLSQFSTELFSPSVEGIGVVDREVSISSPSHPLAFVMSVTCVLLLMLTSGSWFSTTQQPIAHQVSLSQEVFVAALLPEPQPQDNETFFQSQWSSIASNTPSPNELLLNAVNFEKINDGVEPIQGYLDMTADLPGMKPVSNSVNLALHLLKHMSDKPTSVKVDASGSGPDVGYHGDPLARLCFA